MLHALSVKDFVIVDELLLDFSSGLTVLTGETGAGKSIILDALGLALGNRSEGGLLVRQGCERADITACFSYAGRQDIADWLADNSLDTDHDELLLRRQVDKNGRSKSLINGQQVTLAQLRQIGDILVDIHGQHAHQSLCRAETQRQLLDACADALPLARQVGQDWQTWQQANKAWQTAMHNAAASQVERERLDWQINELSQLAISPGEWDSLSQQHDRLAHAAELQQGARLAIDALAEQDGSCQALLAMVQSRLGKLSHLDARLQAVLSLLDSVDAELSDAVHTLRDYTDRFEADPQQLADTERRLESIMSMARKYRNTPDALPDLLAQWQEQRATLEASSDPAHLQAIAKEAEATYLASAGQLRQQRQQLAPGLSQTIADEMQSLAMNGAQFVIALKPLESPGPHGLEDIEYQVATNAGSRLQPLAKIVSGGELSRISLALQVAISQVARVPTLIFDEVDVGVGGRVAEVIGRKLKALGQHYQVLCVTHLPQVASCGDQQWQVSKTVRDGQTLSHITPLAPAERELEIARMLSGTTITETTRRHAAEMLRSNAMIDG